MKGELSISAIARLLELDRRTITRIVGRLQPVGSHRGNALYKVADVARAIIAGRETTQGDVTMAEAKRRRAVAEAEIAETESLRLRGMTIEIEAVVAPFAEQCSAIRARFLGLANRCAPIAAGRDERSIHAIIHAGVIEALSELTADAAVALKAIADDAGQPK